MYNVGRAAISTSARQAGRNWFDSRSRHDRILYPDISYIKFQLYIHVLTPTFDLRDVKMKYVINFAAEYRFLPAPLTFTTLWANSADDKLFIFF